MMKFIGTKTLYAKPMTRLEYCTYRGWPVPDNEDGNDEGYLVEYTDGGKANDPRHEGYISWSPADQFNAAYRESGDMTFGLALEAMKQGRKVARIGWNGNDMWVALGAGKIDVPAADLWNPHTHAFAILNGGRIDVRPYFVLKTAQNDIQMGWSPSQSDALAEDWMLVQ